MPKEIYLFIFPFRRT